MKYFKLLFLGIFCLFILAGCEGNETGMDENPAYEDEQEPFSVVYAHKSMNTYFHQLLNASVMTYTEQQGWSYELAVADYDQIRQNQQIINFLNKEPDVIVASSIDQDRIGLAIEEVKQYGIPVVLIDTGVSGGGADLTVQFDNYLAGQMAAEEIVRLLTEKYGEPEGVVVHGYGMDESSAWVARKQGFEDIIYQYPDIRCIEQGVEGNPKKAREVLLEVLKEQSIDAVHCSSDHPAQGFAEALQWTDNWKRAGEEGHVAFVTIDGDPFAAEQIAEGYYDSSIVQDAVGYGQVLAQLLERYIFAGEKIPAGTYYAEGTWWEEYRVVDEAEGKLALIPPYIMNIENVEDERHWSWIAQMRWGYEYR